MFLPPSKEECVPLEDTLVQSPKVALVEIRSDERLSISGKWLDEADQKPRDPRKACEDGLVPIRDGGLEGGVCPPRAEDLCERPAGDNGFGASAGSVPKRLVLARPEDRDKAAVDRSASTAAAPAATSAAYRLALLEEEEEEEEDQFKSALGFFPRRSSREATPAPHDEAAQLICDVEALTNTGPRLPLPEHSVTPLFPPQLRPSKTDFSHVHPRALAAAATSTWHDAVASAEPAPNPSLSRGFLSSNPAFRSSGDLRWMTATYIEHLDETHLLPDDETLTAIFTEPRVRYLQSRGYDADDVLSWAWILASPNADRAVKRLIAVDDEKQAEGKALVPHFVILQLLRTPHINADSLVRLVGRLRATTAPPLPDASQDRVESGSRKSWDSESATLLLTRLLRHARRVHPPTVEDVPVLASRILLPLHSSGPTVHEILAFSCNRLLTLMSLPSGPRPFQSVIYQQRAQLALIRAMTEQKPQIPLNREGYRALIKVQLAHEKLDRERAWAEAQGDAWPPWPKPRLGIDESKEYAGKVSRAMRVLRRMVEAGYAHFTWEKAAAVLAGWDTDKSPTVQTRHILKPARQAPLAEAVSEADSSPLIAQLWAARITATRTVREAWACFESYRKSIDNCSRRYEPYHAMFTKLIARKQDGQSHSSALPGDSRETFPDPPSPRDLVYIESQPATVADLYEQMRIDGVKPVGRLLTDLTTHASTIAQASVYLRDSGYSELKKDVLLDARKYSDDQVRNIVQGVPNHFFAAFLAMLVRCRDGDSLSRPAMPPWWKDDSSRASQTRALRYALRLLYLSRTKSLQVWNGVLDALRLRMADKHLAPSSFKQMSHSVRNLVDQLRLQQLDTDFATFRALVAIMRLCQERQDGSSLIFSASSLRDHARELYTRAAYKLPAAWIGEVETKPVLAWPEPEDNRSLIEALGVAGDLDGLLCFASWMHTHADVLKLAEERRQKSARRLSQINMIILRIFLEASWAETEQQKQLYSVHHAELMSIKKCLSQSLGWPDDEEVEALLESWPGWLRRVRDAAAAREKMARREKDTR
ncbi:hypothetical protein DV738_g3621, partial [Chaetothyriales sp. CBS 135597]